MRPTRNVLSLICGITLLFLIVSPRVGAAQNQLQLLSNTATYSIGHEFAITLRVQGNNLLGVTSNITYDPASIVFVRVDEAGSAFPANIVFSPGPNKIEIARATTNYNAPSGDLLVETVYFKPVKNGTSQISGNGTIINNTGSATALPTAQISIPTGVPLAAPPSAGNSVGSTPQTTKKSSGTAVAKPTDDTRAGTTPDSTIQTTANDNINSPKNQDIDPQVKAVISHLNSEHKTSNKTKATKVYIGVSVFTVGMLLLALIVWFKLRPKQSPNIIRDETSLHTTIFDDPNVVTTTQFPLTIKSPNQATWSPAKDQPTVIQPDQQHSTTLPQSLTNDTAQLADNTQSPQVGLSDDSSIQQPEMMVPARNTSPGQPDPPKSLYEPQVPQK